MEVVSTPSHCRRSCSRHTARDGRCLRAGCCRHVNGIDNPVRVGHVPLSPLCVLCAVVVRCVCVNLQEATQALALDGIVFNGVQIKVKRPSNFQRALEAGTDSLRTLSTLLSVLVGFAGFPPS